MAGLDYIEQCALDDFLVTGIARVDHVEEAGAVRFLFYSPERVFQSRQTVSRIARVKLVIPVPRLVGVGRTIIAAADGPQVPDTRNVHPLVRGDTLNS